MKRFLASPGTIGGIGRNDNHRPEPSDQTAGRFVACCAMPRRPPHDASNSTGLAFAIASWTTRIRNVSVGRPLRSEQGRDFRSGSGTSIRGGGVMSAPPFDSGHFNPLPNMTLMARSVLATSPVQIPQFSHTEPVALLLSKIAAEGVSTRRVALGQCDGGVLQAGLRLLTAMGLARRGARAAGWPEPMTSQGSIRYQAAVQSPLSLTESSFPGSSIDTQGFLRSSQTYSDMLSISGTTALDLGRRKRAMRRASIVLMHRRGCPEHRLRLRSR